MSDDSGRSEVKRRLGDGYGQADKRLRTHGGGYSSRMRSPSNERERGYEIDDEPSTSSSSSRRQFPFSNTSANSSDRDEYGKQHARMISPRQPTSGLIAGASGSTSEVPPPLHNRAWYDPSIPRERVSHPGPAGSSDRAAGERMPSPPGLTLSTGQPLVNPPLKTQAAFVGKLYSMLEDEEIRQSGLLYWSNNGTTFICPNPTEFSKAILPRYFKHNNWQSFVRQLNMYSFNKVNDLYATSVDPAAWEFRHPLFRQGEPHYLASIKRKTTRPHGSDGVPILSPTEEFGESRMLGTSLPGYGMPPTTPGGAQGAWSRDAHYPPYPDERYAYQTYGNARDMRDPRDTRDDRGVREPGEREPERERAREARSAGGSQVFGIDLKTGKTIESRPYEQTARASTREYFESLRPGSSGAGGGGSGSVSSPHLAMTPGHPRGVTAPTGAGTASGFERYHDRGYPGDRVPPPLSAPPRPNSERQLPPQADVPPHTTSYPQPNLRSVPSSAPASAVPSGTSMNEVEYLQDKVIRLREELQQQTLEGLRREMDAVTYSLSLIDWVPNAPLQDTRNVHYSLSQRVANIRREYEAVLSQPGIGRVESSRDDRYYQGQSLAQTPRQSQASENSFYRASTSTNPVTPLVSHTALSHTRGSGASLPPGTSGSNSAPLSVSTPTHSGTFPPPALSTGPSPASRKLPLPRPSLDSRPSMELRSLPRFPHFPRESMTSPLAFEYLPSSAGAGAGADAADQRRDRYDGGRDADRGGGGDIKKEPGEQYGEPGRWQQRQQQYPQQHHVPAQRREYAPSAFASASGPPRPREDVERKFISPISPKNISRLPDAGPIPEAEPDHPAEPTSPGGYSTGTAPKSSRSHMGDPVRSNGHTTSRSPEQSRRGRGSSSPTHSAASGTRAAEGTSPAAGEHKREGEDEETPTKGLRATGVRDLLN